MFYSHQLLARKTPIGTVWSAAHLQNRLKKSDYANTNILSTVEKIMYPEVPIALRMSSHLLLGIVRIYSKQVEYLYKDCYGVLTGLRKAFSSVNINLPEDATQASFYSITLPERFELDAFADDNSLDRHEDMHTKLPEEITLEDQVPTGIDSYIVITLDQERSRSPVLNDTPESEVQLMAEDVRPPILDYTSPPLVDPSPSNLTELNLKPTEDSTTEVLPDIEIRRDAVHDNHAEVASIWLDNGNDTMEPDPVLEDQLIRDDKIRTPASAETLPSGGYPSPVQQPEEPEPVELQKSHESLDLRIDIGHGTPDLAIQPSPSVEQQRAKHRKRKRLYYDESTVLTNRSMKAALEDPRGILRRKRNCPSSSLDIWKLNKRLKKDSMFLEPLITGLSFELGSLYEEDIISSKPHLRKSEEPHQVLPPTPRSPTEVEIEHPRAFAIPAPHTPMSCRTPEATPSPMNVDSNLDRLETTIRTDSPPTPTSEPPPTPFDKTAEVENSIRSDIPEMDYSVGELSFLEQDENTASGSGSQGSPNSNRLTIKDTETQEYDQLSARTRAVAQYLKRQSSITPSSGDSPTLSLKLILEGKTRKVCARMFNEMLVLKNCELIDVNQEAPFGDITVKVTSKLSKGQLSS